MELTFSSLTVHGKKYIYVLIDYSIGYLYLLTIYEQCITPQESKFIFGFHGHFRANHCNDDNPYLHDFGKVFCCFDYVQLIYIAAYYYLIVDEKTCTAGNSLENSLPHDFLDQQLERLCCIHLRNQWYHPNFHTTFNNFLILMPYGDDVPFILYGMVWVSMIHDIGERIFKGPIFFLPLKGNIIVAQDHNMIYTYHKWRGR